MTQLKLWLLGLSLIAALILGLVLGFKIGRANPLPLKPSTSSGPLVLPPLTLSVTTLKPSPPPTTGPLTKVIERVEFVSQEQPVPHAIPAKTNLRARFLAEKYVSETDIGWKGTGSCEAETAPGVWEILTQTPLDLKVSKAEVAPEGRPQQLFIPPPLHKWAISGVGQVSTLGWEASIGLEHRVKTWPIWVRGAGFTRQDWTRASRENGLLLSTVIRFEF